jgi:hypothetical protein
VASLLLGSVSVIPGSLHGTEDGTFYTPYSILSTVENNWKLSCLGRYDVGANVFAPVAKKSGHVNNKDTLDTTQNSLDESYAGPLNSGSDLGWPVPNPYLVGAGGKGVLGAKAGAGKVTTPYLGDGKVFDGENGNSPVYSTVTSGNVGTDGDGNGNGNGTRNGTASGSGSGSGNGSGNGTGSGSGSGSGSEGMRVWDGSYLGMLVGVVGFVTFWAIS